MSKIEDKCITRAVNFNKEQLTILKAKAKAMTIDDEPEEYYYALALIMYSEREDYLHGKTNGRLTTGMIK